jgi:hypothetical protein
VTVPEPLLDELLVTAIQPALLVAVQPQVAAAVTVTVSLATAPEEV